jgi:hypothetical protein
MHQVTDQLMTKQIEVNPAHCSESFRTPQNIAIKGSSLFQVSYRHGQMEGSQLEQFNTIQSTRLASLFNS